MRERERSETQGRPCRDRRRAAPRTRLRSALLLALALIAVASSSASANLEPLYSEVGHLRLSTDAIGTNAASGVVQVDKPAGAVVERAFLLAASTGISGYTPPDGEVTIDDVAVAWDPAHTIPSSIGSVNVVADVTSLLKDKIDDAPAGRVDFTIAEQNTFQMDGDILAVVFHDPSVPTNTVELMYGAQNTVGDHFAIGLGSPLRASSGLTMGLGISYGFQPSVQYSQIDVDGSRLTTSAGGQDDGESLNGSLITVGGLDDDPGNPSDPMAVGCDEDPRCDDELYDLKPFVRVGDTSVDVDTLNPSSDDNILFASLQLTLAALVGDGVLLTPDDSRLQAGSAFVFFKALVQDEDGDPVVGRDVTLKALSGPSAGLTLHAATGANGTAVFNYISTAVGTDTLRATYTDDHGVEQTSNEATLTWAPRVTGTLGGEWPYHGTLNLYWSYGGGHRYLDNASQGASNWNATGANVHFSQWPGVPYAIHVPMADTSFYDSTYAYTTWQGDCNRCSFIRTPIQFNQWFMDQQSDAQQTKVATHELGHTLGLDHTEDYVDGSVPSVMRRGPLGGPIKQTPQPYDVNRVKAMYP
ncbi:MAG TPA: hypothetical protein VKB03_04225 [Conexibacter sp.]|nr:hypothetical protein [Conexibacter sp.]